MDSNDYGVPSIYADVARSLQGELDASPITRTVYSSDGSPYTITPQIVAHPKTIEDIKKILAVADDYTIPVTVCGKRLNTSGAALTEGIVIDMATHFSNIHRVDPHEYIITVDAGVTVSATQAALAGWGMDIPFLTAQDTNATIGGIVANKNTSPTSHEHGGIGSVLTSMTIVLANGEQHLLEEGVTPSGNLLAIYQQLFPLLSDESSTLRGAKGDSPEDASGYNVWSQAIGPRQIINTIIGSQGTLAIITQVTLRAVPKKEHTRTIAAYLPTYDSLQPCIAIARAHHVDGLFMYDEFLEQRAHATQLIQEQLPEGPHLLTCIMTIDGTDERTVYERTLRLTRALSMYNPTVIPHHVYTSMIAHERVHMLTTSYAQGALIPVVTGNGLIFPYHRIGEALTAIETYHKEKRLIYTVCGNIGSGNISVTTLIPPNKETYSGLVMDTTEHLCVLAKKLGGSASASSGDGLTGTQFLPLFYSHKVLAIFGRIKQIFDPHEILNPGKKGTLPSAYCKQRIILSETVSTLDK